MASEVKICNKALSRIGITQLVESLDDPSEQARQCLLHYEETRDEVLEDFPWNFAQCVLALAPVSVSIPGWRYAYRYPSNCLRAQVITDSGGARLPMLASMWTYDIWDYDAVFPQTNRVPFRIMADPDTEGARIIVTDLPDAYLWYTQRVTSPNQFTTLFRSALSWRLAAEIALGMRADPRLHQNAMDKYGWAVSQGQAHSLNEERPDRAQQSPSITVRR